MNLPPPGRRQAAALWAFGLLLVGAVSPRAEREPKPAPGRQAFTNLLGGTYTSQITGILCEACARSIQKSISDIPAIEKASVDFEKRQLTFTVKADWRVHVSTIRRALREASDRVDLGTEFKLVKLAYLP